MTKKQMTTFLFFWIFTIGGIGFSLNWAYEFYDCSLKEIEIKNSADIQEQWLYTYGYFSALQLEDRHLNKLKNIINIREPITKQRVESFAENCKSKVHKNQLISILKSYNYYLTSKNNLFGEYQDLKWAQNLMPETEKVTDL